MNRLVAAVAAWVFFVPGIAFAADEDQRFRQMEQMIEAQQAQIQMLTKQVQQLVEAAAGSTQTATTMPIAPGRSTQVISPAQKALEIPKSKIPHKTPAPVASGGTKAHLSLSGHVNRAALFYDDGKTSDLRSVDNDNSSTRVRLKGRVKPKDGLTVGSTIEVQIESNSSHDVTQDDNTAAEGTSNDGARSSRKITFTERIIEVFVDSKKFGKLSLGQGNTASNKTAESDLSGTKLVASGDWDDTGGGLFFTRRNGLFSTVTVGSAFSNMDGLSRADRIRYDTPIYRGLQASTSLLDGGAWDAALRYGQKLYTFKVKAAAGYANTSSTSSSMEDQFSGSVSVIHNSGVSLTVAGATRNMSGAASNRDPHYVYGKVGYKAKLLEMGYTAFSADYGSTWDMPVKNAEGDSMAFAVVQKVTDWGTEFYAAYRRLKLDVPGLGLDDLDTILAGARIKF